MLTCVWRAVQFLYFFSSFWGQFGPVRSLSRLLSYLLAVAFDDRCVPVAVLACSTRCSQKSRCLQCVAIRVLLYLSASQGAGTKV